MKPRVTTNWHNYPDYDLPEECPNCRFATIDNRLLLMNSTKTWELREDPANPGEHSWTDQNVPPSRPGVAGELLIKDMYLEL